MQSHFAASQSNGHMIFWDKKWLRSTDIGWGSIHSSWKIIKVTSIAINTKWDCLDEPCISQQLVSIPHQILAKSTQWFYHTTWLSAGLWVNNCFQNSMYKINRQMANQLLVCKMQKIMHVLVSWQHFQQKVTVYSFNKLWFVAGRAKTLLQ